MPGHRCLVLGGKGEAGTGRRVCGCAGGCLWLGGGKRSRGRLQVTQLGWGGLRTLETLLLYGFALPLLQ